MFKVSRFIVIKRILMAVIVLLLLYLLRLV
jgi:hypothetical protein